VVAFSAARLAGQPSEGYTLHFLDSSTEYSRPAAAGAAITAHQRRPPTYEFSGCLTCGVNNSSRSSSSSIHVPGPVAFAAASLGRHSHCARWLWCCILRVMQLPRAVGSLTVMVCFQAGGTCHRELERGQEHAMTCRARRSATASP